MATHDEMVAAFDAALEGRDADAFVGRARARRDRVAQPRPQGGRRPREHGGHRHARPARRRPEDRARPARADRRRLRAPVRHARHGEVERQPVRDAQLPDRHHHRRRADQPHRRVRRPDRGSPARHDHGRRHLPSTRRSPPRWRCRRWVRSTSGPSRSRRCRRCVRRMADMPARRAAADHDRVVRGGGARRDRSRPERARVLAADEGDRATVRLLDPRRRLPVRLRAHRRRPASTAGSRSSTASRCRSTTGSRRRTRTRRRSTTATPGCCGPRSTPTSWASTRRASRSPGRAPAVGSPPGWRSSPATAARSTLAFQLLIYPMIDDRNTSASSHIDGRAGVEPRREPPRVARPTWASCSGPTTSPRTRRPAGSRASAGSRRRGSASASLDVFRDEDIDVRVAACWPPGIPAELHVYPGACHGFEMIVPDCRGRAGVSARHHGGVAAGVASGVLRRVHQLTPRVSPR